MMNSTESRAYFSTFQLKFIALICMVFDHAGQFFPEIMPQWFRYIGRISAPLFLFCLVWGMDYTRNRFYYLLRIYCASLGMEVLWTVLNYFLPYNGTEHNNIFTTFFNIGVLITLVSLVRRKMLKKIYAILFLVVWQLSSTLLILLINYKNLQEWTHFVGALSGNFFVCEGGIMWVSLGIILYCIKNTQIKLFSGYSIFCLFCSLCSLTAPLARAMYFLEFFTNIDQTVIWQILEIIYVLILGNAWYFTPVVPHGLYFGDYQWMMIAALPFMMLYNRKRGCKIKTFFYLFYPIHILIFLLISRFLIILQ